MSSVNLPQIPPYANVRSIPELQAAISFWTKLAWAAINDLAENGGTTYPIADATHTGILLNTDWISFNSRITDAPSDGSTYGRKNGAWAVAGGSVSTGNLTESGSSILTIGGGTGAVVGSGTTIDVTKSDATHDGYLSSTDWTTFNSKQTALTFGNFTEATSSVLTITGGTGAVIGSGLSIQVKQSSASVNGYLSSADWNTFNGKQAALTIGNFTEATSSVLTISGGTGAIIGSGLSVQVKQAGGSLSGYLSSTDWTTFNSKLSDAPSDGTTYGRLNGAWSAVGGGGGGTDVLQVQVFS